MLPPCLSLEKSFRKREGGKKKKKNTLMCCAQLGLSHEAHVQTQISPGLWGGCSALCLGLQGGWSHAVCETEVSETQGGNGRGENTEEGPKELVAF